QVSIIGADGEAMVLNAVVDTGFNGSLTLPAAIIERLDLPWRNRGSAILRDGNLVDCDIYSATIVWDGQRRSILVESAETDPLVGMRQMEGYRIIIDDVDGGPVTMTRI